MPRLALARHRQPWCEDRLRSHTSRMSPISNKSLLVLIAEGIVAGRLAGQITRGGGCGLIGDLIVGISGLSIGYRVPPRLSISSARAWAPSGGPKHISADAIPATSRTPAVAPPIGPIKPKPCDRSSRCPTRSRLGANSGPRLPNAKRRAAPRTRGARFRESRVAEADREQARNSIMRAPPRRVPSKARVSVVSESYMTPPIGLTSSPRSARRST
jgi:uncharacterized membrane protein YeaQ/YmgE (transglycosylase-associated protein family)